MLEAHARSETGRVRKTNQDTFRIVTELGLCILADGMGGARGGERAASIATDAIAAAIGTAPCRDAAALIGAVETANNAVLREAQSDRNLEGMGTTVVAALETKPGDIAVASVGDSRAWLFREGQLRSITRDQTWVEEIGRGLGLTEEELRSHPRRHMLTMAVGAGPEVRILYYAVELTPGDLMMLTSDGVHGVIPEDEMARILGENVSLEEKCGLLMSAVEAAGSPDNATVVLLRRG